MKSALIAVIIVLAGTAPVSAQTYHWTDRGGTEHYTDNPESIPANIRGRVVTSGDITTRDPKIQEEVRQQEERARQDAAAQRPVVVTPDYVPTPQPVVATPPPPGDELPPGRTKSQRIRDNIERRKAEEERESGTRP